MKRLGLATILVGLLVSNASADDPWKRPWTGYVVTPSEERPGVIHGAASERYNRIIYVNLDGGTYTPGAANDSSSNVSTITNNVATIGPWMKGDLARAEVMDCVKELFAPFNITVTDVDPGQRQHIEAAFGGRPQDLGLDPMVGGIAPSAPGCGIVERAIVYVFDVWGDNTRDICETIAQEAGHAFGLDHEFLCQDPMTYLFGCGEKTFQDIDAECGEYEARMCSCGRQRQNSVTWLLDKVGAPDTVPPMHTLDQPTDGATVSPGFIVSGETSDPNRGMHVVELWIDGEVVATTPITANYEFTAPLSLSFGQHEVSVHAFDLGGNDVAHTVTVTIEPECEGTTGCEGTDTCVDGICLGGLGGECGAHEECSTGICGNNPAGGMACTQSCNAADPASCPEGFSCGSSGTCWAAMGGGDDGCTAAAGGRRGAAPLAAGLILLAMLALVRRRA